MFDLFSFLAVQEERGPRKGSKGFSKFRHGSNKNKKSKDKHHKDYQSKSSAPSSPLGDTTFSSDSHSPLSSIDETTRIRNVSTIKIEKCDGTDKDKAIKQQNISTPGLPHQDSKLNLLPFGPWSISNKNQGPHLFNLPPEGKPSHYDPNTGPMMWPIFFNPSSFSPGESSALSQSASNPYFQSISALMASQNGFPILSDRPIRSTVPQLNGSVATSPLPINMEQQLQNIQLIQGFKGLYKYKNTHF